jgi:hypothetical protein
MMAERLKEVAKVCGISIQIIVFTEQNNKENVQKKCNQTRKLQNYKRKILLHSAIEVLGVFRVEILTR